MVKNTKTKVEIENETLKTMFKDKEFLVKLIRALFFGWDLTAEEKDMIRKEFVQPETREAFRKKFFAKFGDDTTIGQIADAWIGISDDRIVGQTETAIKQIKESREQSMKMLEQAMKQLANPNEAKVNLTYSSSDIDPLGIKLLARNRYMNTVEGSLSMIYQMANMKDVTPETIKTALKKNSSK